MSGKKSWQVASVLNEVEKVYDSIVDEYKNEIEDNISFVNKMENKKNEIEEKIEKLNDISLKKELSNFDDYFNRANEIKDEMMAIFRAISENKQKTKILRKKIANSSHYMDKEYNEAQNIKMILNNSKNKLISLKNESLILRNKVLKINNVLKNINNLYEAKKKSLIDYLNKTKNRFEEKKYIKIEDYVENKDIKISGCEFVDNYKKSNYCNKIFESLKKAENLVRNDEFEKGEKLLNEINEMLNEIFTQADEIKENIYSSFNFTLKIRNLMRDEINFRRVRIELIDDNPINGFKLICENGDTLIFDEIKVENGDVKVELNHIEKVAGSCNIKWKEMKKILNENGIPLMDITKNGKSIFQNRVIEKVETKRRTHGK